MTLPGIIASTEALGASLGVKSLEKRLVLGAGDDELSLSDATGRETVDIMQDELLRPHHSSIEEGSCQ